MLEEQLKELALIVKNDDLRKYAGNAFWNLIQAVISKDPEYAPSEARKKFSLERIAR